MAVEKDVHRMTLRELLTSAEKAARALAEHLHTTMLARATDSRELSRPVRKRSHYPTVVALVNSLNKLREGEEETQAYVDRLLELMEAIRDQARRERFRR